MRTGRLIEHASEVTRLAPVRPAVKAGLRAAIAIFVPVLLASALHLTGGLWLSVGAFNASFADKGGSYRSRAKAMGSVALFGALAVFLGGLAGRQAALAVPVTFLWVTAAGYAGAYGPVAAFTGSVSSNSFVIALALPAAGIGSAAANAGFSLAGAAWAMLLSLLFWPVRPYRPARFAVGRSYRTLAEFAAGVRQTVGNPDPAAWQALMPLHGRVREGLEAARHTLAETRRGRTESGRGERLLVLLQAADASFETLVALADGLEAFAHRGGARAVQEEAARVLFGFEETLAKLAAIAEMEGAPGEVRAPAWDAGGLRRALAASDADAAERAEARHLVRLFDLLLEYASAALETASGLASDRAKRLGARVSGFLDERRPPLVEPLRENLSRDSVVLRHALRVGVTTAVAVALTRGLGHSHGYWVTITVVTILQPYSGPTFLKGLQRVLGTVVGGILAALVAAWLHDPHALLGLVFFTAATSVAMLPVNYGVYTVFLTLTFVLLAELGTGDWNLAEVRIVNTIIGGALALAGSRLLWERPERELVPENIAAVLRADRAYFQAACDSWLGEKASPGALVVARRKMGLAANNAEASFQRLLSEPRRRTEPLEPLMTMLAFLRRFASSVIAFASTDSKEAPPEIQQRVRGFEQATIAVLAELASAIPDRRRPAPMPDFQAILGLEEHAGEAHPLVVVQLERVVRQLSVLHGAAVRWAGAG